MYSVVITRQATSGCVGEFTQPSRWFRFSIDDELVPAIETLSFFCEAKMAERSLKKGGFSRWSVVRRDVNVITCCGAAASSETESKQLSVLTV